MTRTVLILGARGRFGRAAHAAFSWAGWDVRLFDRSRDTLDDAAWGAELIVNAFNPTYPDWAAEVPRLTQKVIEVAQNTGATVLIPGNIYSYGAAMPDRLDSMTPHAPTCTLGQIRYDMERAYKEAGVRTIILRAGDFIDTSSSGNWYDQIITAKIAKGKMVYPGDPDVAHAWTYLPDLADAAVALTSCDLPRFAEVNFPGYTLTGRELCETLQDVIERPLTLKKMNWLPISLARPFWPMARYLMQMRYLWNTPHSMDSTQFEQLVPDFKATPLEDALISSLPDDIHPNRLMSRRAVPLSFSCWPVDA